MKKLKVLLSVLLLSICGMASASTTVLNASGNLNGFIDAKSYGFDITQSGLYDATFSVASSNLAVTLFGVFDKVGNTWAPVSGTVGSGSFDFTAVAGTQYKAVLGDINLAGNKLAYSVNISAATPVPEPETWAIMLLGIGFVVYQVRPRKTVGRLSIQS